MPEYKYKNLVIYQTPGEQEVFRNELKDLPEGDLAEIGVYQGGTAVIMREEHPNRELYLFDTFTGLADELHESDPKHYYVGHCDADESFIQEALKGDKKVYITKGIFPSTSDIIKDKKFAFVHIDVDVYNATKNALAFFLSRMVKGGKILVHDYPAHSGVKLAVDEMNLSGLKEINNRQLIIQL